MRGYKTQNNNTSSDLNVNSEQDYNQSGQNNSLASTPKPTNQKVLLIVTIVVVVGIGLGILVGYLLFGGNDGDGGNYDNDGNSENTEENMTATTGSENGHDWVDLGLPSGIKWATTNVGANVPEDYGDYFAWGEISPKSTYDLSNYIWCRGDWFTLTKYCTNPSNGTVDNNTTLFPNDDAAHVNWGGNWRMPTKEEFDELLHFCAWSWISVNNKNGCKVTGPNGNFIFLPAAGTRTHEELYGADSYGYFWSSTLDSNDNQRTYSILLYSDEWYVISLARHEGQSVRAVCP